MTDIRFYHLLARPLGDALPAILAKAIAGGHRVLVRFGDPALRDHFDDLLWTYAPESFLPHATDATATDPLAQPVLLTSAATGNPNAAGMLVLTGGQPDMPDDIESFSLCCDFLDGRDDDAVDAARARWKAYKAAGHDVIYYQQTESGGWDRKA